MMTPQGAIGCQKMMDEYCAFMYSPDALGNLQIKRSNESFTVLQGDTDNDFSQVYYRYAKAKLKHRAKLPQDLQNALKPYSYFQLLKHSLARRPRKVMTLEERLRAERLDSTLDSAWSAAISETVWLRLARKFPGVHQLSERQMPPEYEIEAKKIRRVLISEISKALWSDDANWKMVERVFQQLQGIYVQVINQIDMPPEQQQNWKNRIANVKLALPSSLPEIADQGCASTTINAYYYRYLDVITVCAGDFNSEDIVLTLAHEMAHALDISRSFYLQKVKSELGRAQTNLRSQICGTDPHAHSFSCEQWTEFKEKFDERLVQMSRMPSELPAFNQCLKRKVTSRTPTADDLTRVAQSMTIGRYSNFAANGSFLRIVKKTIPLRSGRLAENPYYLDPCRYYTWSHGEEPPDEELSSLIYFTAEYRCMDPKDTERFRKAIEVSKAMSEKIIRSVLQLEGEFSARSTMEREGFSSSPIERFADVIGSHAMATYLKVFPHITDRRAHFLTSSSWQCSEPSLMSRYPDESRIESEYTFARHTEGNERRREILSEPIRETLTCEKDFESTECSLPLKHTSVP